jgi:molecular chaperone GrpE
MEEHERQEPYLETPTPPEGDSQASNEVAELKDKLLRALADAENARRRAAKEREDTAKYAVANFARDMLGIADNLRRALDNAPADEACRTFVQGVDLTERSLLSALERYGIRKLDPKGERYNPEFHEAMFEIPTAEAPPGTIIQVVEPGYMIHDRLLRPARVAVAKAVNGGGEPGQQVDTRA